MSSAPTPATKKRVSTTTKKTSEKKKPSAPKAKKEKTTGAAKDKTSKKRSKTTSASQPAKKKAKGTDGSAPKPKKEKKVALPGLEGAAAALSDKEKTSARNISLGLKCEKREKYGVRKQPYRRILNFYAHEKVKDLRMASGVPRCLQGAVEQKVIQLLMKAVATAMAAKRNTVIDSDVDLQSFLEAAENGDTSGYKKWQKEKSKQAANRSKKSKDKAAEGKAAAALDGSAPKPKKEKKVKAAKAVASAAVDAPMEAAAPPVAVVA